MGDIRETFETAHKVLIASDQLMEAFGAFHRRIQRPHEYDGSEPYECRTPGVLFQRWDELHSLFEQLEICYLYDPASKADILRALSSRPAVPVHALLNVTAETHVEAAYLIAAKIYSSIRWLCESMANSYEAIDRQPAFAADCERAADKVRDYVRNGRIASQPLDYLRRAVAIEEATCREFFEPSTAAPSNEIAPGVQPTTDTSTWPIMSPGQLEVLTGFSADVVREMIRDNRIPNEAILKADGRPHSKQYRVHPEFIANTKLLKAKLQ